MELSKHLRATPFVLAAVVLGVLATVHLFAAPEDAFQYNIISVTLDAERFPSVTFSVTNPGNSNQPYDLTDPAWRDPAGASRLFLHIASDAGDDTHDASGRRTGPGDGAVLPIGIDVLARAVRNADGTYTVTSLMPLPPSATGTVTVALEGYPALDLDGDGIREYRAPVESAFKTFAN